MRKLTTLVAILALTAIVGCKDKAAKEPEKAKTEETKTEKAEKPAEKTAETPAEKTEAPAEKPAE